MTIATATRLFDNIIEFPRPVQEGGKSNEWYTPARYIEAARQVMGGIDLDPASCELANRTVKATRYYTQQENGLAQPWYRNVWLNPPYKLDKSLPNEYRSTVAKWVNKLLAHYQCGDIQQAIMLVTSRHDAVWFEPLWQFPICFAHRLWFEVPYGSTSRPGRNRDTHMLGSCFVYLGPNEHKFVEVFSQFGRIAKAIDTPRQTVRLLSLWEEVAL